MKIAQDVMDTKLLRRRCTLSLIVNNHEENCPSNRIFSFSANRISYRCLLFLLNGKQTKYTSLFLTISRIPTTLKYLALFPVSVGGAVEIMPDNLQNAA